MRQAVSYWHPNETYELHLCYVRLSQKIQSRGNKWTSFSASFWDRMFLMFLILCRWKEAVLETCLICGSHVLVLTQVPYIGAGARLTPRGLSDHTVFLSDVEGQLERAQSEFRSKKLWVIQTSMFLRRSWSWTKWLDSSGFIYVQLGVVCVTVEVYLVLSEDVP